MCRRGILNCIVLFTALLLMCGCKSQIPELSEDDKEIVTRYMADSLLRHDVSYKATLLNEEEKAAEEQKRKEIAEELERQKAEEERILAEKEAEKVADNPEVVGGKKNEDILLTDVDEFLGIDNTDITYVGYEVCDVYPKEEELVLSVKATEGHKLLVLNFHVENTDAGENAVDLSELAVKYRFSVNGEAYKSALMTFLESDLATYSGEFAPKEGTECVLMIEVLSDVSIDSIMMQIRKNDTNEKGTFALAP